MSETQALSNAALWNSLDRWYQVIQHYLRRGRAPRGMTDEAYSRLYRELRSHFDSLPDGELSRLDRVHQSLYRSLRPWVRLDSLAKCDKRILRMLEKEIRFIRDQLMPRERWRAHVFNRIAAMLVLLSLAVIIIGFLFSGDPRAAGIIDQFDAGLGFFDGIRAQLWIAITQSSTNQRLIALAGSMLVIGTFFLRDRRRI